MVQNKMDSRILDKPESKFSSVLIYEGIYSVSSIDWIAKRGNLFQEFDKVITTAPVLFLAWEVMGIQDKKFWQSHGALW